MLEGKKGNALFIAVVLLFVLAIVANSLISTFFTKRRETAQREMRGAAKLSNSIAIDIGNYLVQSKVIQGYYSVKLDTVFWIIETAPAKGSPYFIPVNAMNLKGNVATIDAGFPGQHQGWKWNFKGGYTQKYAIAKGEPFIATLTATSCNTELMVLNALIPSFSKTPTFPICGGAPFVQTQAQIVDTKNGNYAEWVMSSKVDLALAK